METKKTGFGISRPSALSIMTWSVDTDRKCCLKHIENAPPPAGLSCLVSPDPTGAPVTLLELCHDNKALKFSFPSNHAGKLKILCSSAPLPIPHNLALN
jgi:hypothetical protein